MKKNVSIIVAATAPIGWLLIGLAVIVLFAGWAAIEKLLLFIVVVSSASLAHAIWLAFFVPELAAQRSSIHANTKTWERPLLLVYMLNKLILGPMAIGLRFGTYSLVSTIRGSADGSRPALSAGLGSHFLVNEVQSVF